MFRTVYCEPLLTLVLLLLVGEAIGQQNPTPAEVGEVTPERVRNSFSKDGFAGADAVNLYHAGAHAFPAYEVVLSDPASHSGAVGGVLAILRVVKDDPSRFAGLARKRLTDPDASVRREAIFLIGRIGTAQDTPALVAFLSGDSMSAADSAAWALSRIGSEPELRAFDVWLLTGRHRDDADLRKHVTKCRDDLKQRLEKPKKSGK